MTPKAFVFDMDGTLVDSVDLHAKAWHEALRHFGKEVSFDEVRAQIGKGGDQIVPYFFDEQTAKRITKDVGEYELQVFRTRYKQQVQPFPGVRALFEAIRAAGLKTAIATSSPKGDLEDNERLAGIDDLVDAHSTADDAEKSKPHPDIFQAVLEQLDGITADDAIAVGDSPYDAEAARKARMRAIGFRCGGFPEEWLRKAGCFEIFEGPEDMLSHLDRLMG